MAPNEAVQKALDFARQTGQSEIEAIDRLHKRTLSSLYISVALLGLIGALLSFIGFQNLSRIATRTTTVVVQRRLEDQLTQKHIDEAVQTALQSHAEREIEKAVDAQVAGAVQKEVSRQSGSIQHLTEAYTSEAVSRLDPQIEAIAREEAKKMLERVYAQRTLTQEQRETLTATARSLGPMSVEVASLTDSEATRFATQIGTALAAGGWKVQFEIDLAAGEGPTSGLIIGSHDPNKPDAKAASLLKCLRAAGFDPKVVEDPEKNPESRLIVLSKPQ